MVKKKFFSKSATPLADNINKGDNVYIKKDNFYDNIYKYDTSIMHHWYISDALKNKLNAICKFVISIYGEYNSCYLHFDNMFNMQSNNHNVILNLIFNYNNQNVEYNISFNANVNIWKEEILNNEDELIIWHTFTILNEKELI
mgnify:CR=1 FL=1